MRLVIVNALLIILISTVSYAQNMIIHKADGTFITISVNEIDSISFSYATQAEPCPDTPTVADIDGNIYNTVLIGGQCWMAENLKVTHYRNGEPVSFIGPDNNAWANATSGAYSWYDNDIGMKDIFGALYNWLAVDDARGLCPLGWRMPTDDDWTSLTGYLGGEVVAGGKIKSTGLDYWEFPNAGATNESGFTGLPGGMRFSTGHFTNIGFNGFWWSSTSKDDQDAWQRHLTYNGILVFRSGFSKKTGMSCRCIRE